MFSEKKRHFWTAPKKWINDRPLGSGLGSTLLLPSMGFLRFFLHSLCIYPKKSYYICHFWSYFGPKFFRRGRTYSGGCHHPPPLPPPRDQKLNHIIFIRIIRIEKQCVCIVPYLRFVRFREIARVGGGRRDFRWIIGRRKVDERKTQKKSAEER